MRLLRAVPALLLVVVGVLAPTTAARADVALSSGPLTSTGGPGHDGHSDTSLGTDLSELWSVPGSYSQSIVVGGRVLTVLGGTQVMALAARTGEVLWGPESFGPILSMASDAGRLYLRTPSGYLAALDERTGARLWLVALGNTDSASILAAGGRVIVGGQRVQARDEADGRQLWQSDPVYNAGSPSYSNGTVVVSSYCSGLHGFSAATGASVWQSSAGDGSYCGSFTSPVPLSAGRAYRDSSDGTDVYDAATGASLPELPGSYEAAPSFDDGIMVRTEHGQVRAYATATGDVLWTSADEGYSGVVFTAGQRVFAVTSSGRIDALDELDGSTAWSGPDPGGCCGAPADLNANDGIVLVSSNTGLRAVGDRSQLPTAVAAPAAVVPTLGSAGSSGGESEWGQVAGNAQHTYVAPSDAVTAPLSAGWSSPTGRPVATAIAPGAVLVTTTSGSTATLNVLDPTTGDPLHPATTLSGTGGSLVYSDGVAVVGTGYGSQVGVRVDTGVQIWRNDSFDTGSITVEGRRLYVGGNLFDILTGERFHYIPGVPVGAAVEGSTTVGGATCGPVVRTDGDRLTWSTSAGYGCWAYGTKPAQLQSDRVVVRDVLVAYSPQTLEVARTDGSVDDISGVDGLPARSGDLEIAASPTGLLASQVRSHRLVWSAMGLTGPAIIVGSEVIARSADAVVVLSALDGHQLSSSAVPAVPVDPSLNPVPELAVGQGLVVVPTATGVTALVGTDPQRHVGGPPAPSPATPLISSEPDDATAEAETSVTFHSDAVGSPSPLPQWQVSTDAGASWTDVLGATSDQLTFSSVQRSQDGYQYRAVWTNATGAAYSRGALLQVLPAKRDQRQLYVHFLQGNQVGTPLGASGSLEDGYGNTVTAAVVLHVTRLPSTRLPDITNGSGGWAFHDTPPAGTYHYQVTLDADYPAASATLDVKLTASPKTGTIALSGTQTVTYGSSGTLKVSSLPPHAAFTVLRGSTTVATGTADASGRATAQVKPGLSTSYTAHFAGDDTYGPATSGAVVVSVRPRLSVTATRTSTRTYRFNGSIAPHLAGRTITLYARSTNGTLTALARATTTASGAFVLSHVFARAGRVELFVRSSADARLVSGDSAHVRLDVR